MPAVIDIADVVHKGVSFRWQNKSLTELMSDSRIPQDVNSFLDALLEAAVPYVLVGGIALLQYIESRNTEDIDFILALKDAEKIQGLELQEINEFFARGKFQSLTVDILRAENPFFHFIQSTEQCEAAFLGRSLHTATAKGLALLKLYALPSLYRQHQHTRVHIYEADIQSLIESANLQNDELLENLTPFMPASDISELAKILTEFSQHRNRFS